MSRETVGSIDPFGPTADPASYVPRRASDAALAALATALAGGAATAALSGPPGLGKTLVLRVLERRLAEQHTTVWLPYAALAPDELFAWTLGLLGEPPPAPGRAEAALLVVARDAAALGQPLVVLIDDASAMPTASAERVGALVRASAGAMQVVAAGLEDATVEPSAATDAAPWARALGPATVRVRLLEPMLRDDVARLLRTRLEASGAPASLLARVDEALVRRIYTATAGIPRDVNALASEWLRRGDVVLPRDVAPPDTPEASSLPAAPTPRAPGAPVSRDAPTPSRATSPVDATPASSAATSPGASPSSGVTAATRPPPTVATPDATSAPASSSPSSPPSLSSPPPHATPPAPQPSPSGPAAAKPVMTPAAPAPRPPTPAPAPAPAPHAAPLAPAPAPVKPLPAPPPPPPPAPASAPRIEGPSTTPVNPAPTPGREAATAAPSFAAASIRKPADAPAEERRPSTPVATPVVPSPGLVETPVAKTAAQPPPPGLSRPSSPTLARAPRRIEIFVGVLLLAGAALLLPWLREGSEPSIAPARPAPEIAPAPRGELPADVRDVHPDREAPPPAPAPAQQAQESEPGPALTPGATSPSPPVEPDPAAQPEPTQDVQADSAESEVSDAPEAAAELAPAAASQDGEVRDERLDAQAAAPEAAASPPRPAEPAHEAEVAPMAETAPAPLAAVPVEPEVAPPAAETPPAPAAVVPPPIGVHINAVPWAVIEVDGVDLGETPLSGVPLVPGPHRFRARLPDGRAIERTIDVSDANRHVSFE